MVQPQGSAVNPPFRPPNLYQLSNGTLHVSYLTSGLDGRPYLTYHDAQRTLQFNGDQIRHVDLPDLGTVISVTLASTVDAGSTTFSVVLPHVNLPNQMGASVTIRAEGITTVHRFSLVPVFNQGQRDLYTVTPLHGTASIVAT